MEHSRDRTGNPQSNQLPVPGMMTNRQTAAPDTMGRATKQHQTSKTSQLPVPGMMTNRQTAVHNTMGRANERHQTKTNQPSAPGRPTIHDRDHDDTTGVRPRAYYTMTKLGFAHQDTRLSEQEQELVRRIAATHTTSINSHVVLEQDRVKSIHNGLGNDHEQCLEGPLLAVIRDHAAYPGFAESIGIELLNTDTHIMFSGGGGNAMTQARYLGAEQGQRAVQRMRALMQTTSLTDATLYELIYGAANHSIASGDGIMLAEVTLMDYTLQAIMQTDQLLQSSAATMLRVLITQTLGPEQYSVLRSSLFPDIPRQTYERYMHEAIKRQCAEEHDLSRQQIKNYFVEHQRATPTTVTSNFCYADEELTQQIIPDIMTPTGVLDLAMHVFTDRNHRRHGRPYGRLLRLHIGTYRKQFLFPGPDGPTPIKNIRREEILLEHTQSQTDENQNKAIRRLVEATEQDATILPRFNRVQSAIDLVPSNSNNAGGDSWFQNLPDIRGGGDSNTLPDASYTAVGGGEVDLLLSSSDASYTAVGGGEVDLLLSSSNTAKGGGDSNTLPDASYTAVGGGDVDSMLNISIKAEGEGGSARQLHMSVKAADIEQQLHISVGADTHFFCTERKKRRTSRVSYLDHEVGGNLIMEIVDSRWRAG